MAFHNTSVENVASYADSVHYHNHGLSSSLVTILLRLHGLKFPVFLMDVPFLVSPTLPFVLTEQLWGWLRISKCYIYLSLYLYYWIFICYSQFFNILFMFRIRHSVSGDRSKETNSCCLHASHFFLNTRCLFINGFKFISSSLVICCY